LVSARTAATLSSKNCTSSSAVMLDDDIVAELLSHLSKDDMDCQSRLPLHGMIRQVQYYSSFFW